MLSNSDKKSKCFVDKRFDKRDFNRGSWSKITWRDSDDNANKYKIY
jgi:hypothetical protein